MTSYTWEERLRLFEDFGIKISAVFISYMKTKERFTWSWRFISVFLQWLISDFEFLLFVKIRNNYKTCVSKKVCWFFSRFFVYVACIDCHVSFRTSKLCVEAVSAHKQSSFAINPNICLYLLIFFYKLDSLVSVKKKNESKAANDYCFLTHEQSVNHVVLFEA